MLFKAPWDTMKVSQDISLFGYLSDAYIRHRATLILSL